MRARPIDRIGGQHRMPVCQDIAWRKVSGMRFEPYNPGALLLRQGARSTFKGVQLQDSCRQRD